MGYSIPELYPSLDFAGYKRELRRLPPYPAAQNYRQHLLDLAAQDRRLALEQYLQLVDIAYP